MSFTWKDTLATVSIVAIVALTISMMAGFMDTVDARWAFGSLGVFLLAGLTGLITGTARMMEHAWSSIALYLLTASALTITVINAFLNSEAWMIALTINFALIWLEFVSIDLFTKTHATKGGTHMSAGGVS